MQRIDYEGNEYQGFSVMCRASGGYKVLCPKGHEFVAQTYRLYRMHRKRGGMKCKQCRIFPEKCKENPNWIRWSAILKRARKRGIPIDPRWGTFANFYEDMGDVPQGKFIDRINNDLGYTKSNCRWATPKESTENRRNTVWIKVKGKKMRVEEVAKLAKIPPSRVYSRLARNWKPREILEKGKVPHGFHRNGRPAKSGKCKEVEV